VPLKDALKDGEASSAKVALAACVSIIETFLDRTRWYDPFKDPSANRFADIIGAFNPKTMVYPQCHASGDEI
jgi:hypothetical protein